jgi:chloramphenicol 3-O phosphotransferase
MKPGTILLVNGTSSSGKTSLVRAIQDLLPEPFLEAGIDKFIWMLPKRYLDRPLWDAVLGRAVEAGRFGHALVAGMHQAIAALSQSGLNVVADHVLVEPAWARQCADLFADLPAYLVGIRCPLEVLEARERSRRDRTLGQARAQFDRIHRHARYDLELDTSRLDPSECARQVQARLQTPPSALRAMREAFQPDFSLHRK